MNSYKVKDLTADVSINGGSIVSEHAEKEQDLVWNNNGGTNNLMEEG